MEFSLHPSIDWSSSKKNHVRWHCQQFFSDVQCNCCNRSKQIGTTRPQAIHLDLFEKVLFLVVHFQGLASNERQSNGYYNFCKGAHFWNTLIKTRLLLALWGSYTECVGTCLCPLCCFEHEFHKPVEKDFVAFNLIIYSNSSISVWRLLFNSIGIGFQQQQRQTHAALPLRCVCAVLALSVCLKTCAQSFEFVES